MGSAKVLVFDEEARLKLSDGIDKLSETINITLGPKGRHVALSRTIGAPKITSDSNHIIDEIELRDQFENLAVQLAQSMSAKIKENTGDGITTGLVIMSALVKEGLKNIAGGASPVFIKKGLEKGLETALKAIKALALPVKSEQETKNIATVSAKGNQEIGSIIASCFQKVGKDGVISIEEAKGLETKIELVEGMEIERGYISPYFCTNLEKLTVEMNNPYILITDKKISSVHDLLSILQNVSAIGSELLIIAEDLEGDALAALVINKLKGILKVAAIKAPSFGDERKAVLEDIAILTGGTFYSEEKGLTITKAILSDLGKAQKVFISKDTTTFIDGNGHKEAVEKRILEIAKASENSTNAYDKEKLEKRKAKLKGGVAIIRVGAGSDPELKDKKNIFEDSLAATRAALEEGIVAGGGVSLLRASTELEKLILTEKKSKIDKKIEKTTSKKSDKKAETNEEELIGIKILQKALLEPAKILMQNSGIDPHLFLERILNDQNKNMGFNVEAEKIEDLLKAGIIDPVKVVKNSLIHAVSTGSMLLISDALIGEDKS